MIADILESAETDLNVVTRSVISADPGLLEESRELLEKLVLTLTALRRSASAIPPGDTEQLRDRLGRLQVKLGRLQILGEAAACSLRRRAENAYTVLGPASCSSDLTTVSLDC